MKLTIIGSGLGNKKFLTEEAKDAITSADFLLSTMRLASWLDGISQSVKTMSLSEINSFCEENTHKNIAILATGDVGFYSISKTLFTQFGELFDVEMINGISSRQYFAAKLNKTYDDMLSVSLHGRDGNAVGAVTYNKKVFLLTGGQNTPDKICKTLVESGLGSVLVWIGQNLGSENEAIISGTSIELCRQNFSDLSVMIIENQNAVNAFLPIYDRDLTRGKVPMTKEEIRWTSVNKLGILPNDIVYDIGAGTGSVSLEMAKKANLSMVYALERKEEACSLIEENKQKLGIFNVNVVHGNADESINCLPVADKVFIGGTNGKMENIFSQLFEKNPLVKICVNTVTLESLNDAISAFKKYGIQPEITCINTSKSEKIGRYNMMKANNPIYILNN